MLLWVLQACVFWRVWSRSASSSTSAGPAVYVVMFILCGYLSHKAGWSAIRPQPGAVTYTGLESIPVMLVRDCPCGVLLLGTMLNSVTSPDTGNRSRRSSVGNFLGLPVNFLVFSVLVVVTASLDRAGVR